MKKKEFSEKLIDNGNISHYPTVAVDNQKFIQRELFWNEHPKIFLILQILMVAVRHEKMLELPKSCEQNSVNIFRFKRFSSLQQSFGKYLLFTRVVCRIEQKVTHHEQVETIRKILMVLFLPQKR